MTNALIRKQQLGIAFCEATIEQKVNLEVAFLDFGRRLKKIRDERLYEGQWDSFGQYCLELKGTSETSASRLIGLYETLVVKYAIPLKQIAVAGGWSVIAETLPMMTTKKEALHWLHEATHSTRTDLRRTLKEVKTGKPMAKCAHRQYVVYRTCMDGCGLRERIEDTRV